MKFENDYPSAHNLKMSCKIHEANVPFITSNVINILILFIFNILFYGKTGYWPGKIAL